MKTERIFTLQMEARDYECDLQGIVNNSVYLNYFEHTRHAFLRSIGLDFHELHDEGYDAVVRRVEINYRRSLTGLDAFTSSLRISKKGRLQYVFDQTIHRLTDGEEMTKACTFVAFVHRGRPVPPPDKVTTAVDRWLTGKTGTNGCM